MQRRLFLVIGCGQNDAETFEKEKMSHQKLHPSDQFDTLNLNPNSAPSFVADINKSDEIATHFPKSQYQLVVLERFPADKIYFMLNTALSVKHLIDKNGMVVFMPTGDRIANFDYLITTMMQVEFNKCVVSGRASLMFFLNCENDAVALNRIKHFISTVPYVAQLLSLGTLLKQSKDVITNLEHHLWDCAALHEAYVAVENQLGLGKKPRALEIEAIIAKGQPRLQEPKENKEPQAEVTLHSVANEPAEEVALRSVANESTEEVTLHGMANEPTEEVSVRIREEERVPISQNGRYGGVFFTAKDQGTARQVEDSRRSVTHHSHTETSSEEADVPKPPKRWCGIL